VLHHEVVDFLCIFVPPFLLVVCVVEAPLPFRCLNKVGRVQRIWREDNGWRFEFSYGERGERAIVLEAVCNVFGDGLDVEVEGGLRLGSPRVVKDDVS